MVHGCACSPFTLITIRPIDERQRRPASGAHRSQGSARIRHSPGVVGHNSRLIDLGDHKHACSSGSCRSAKWRGPLADLAHQQIPPHQHRRGVWLAGAYGALLGNHPLVPAQPLFGQQGGQRTPGERVAPHLRPLAVSREADPGRWPQRARLAVSGRPRGCPTAAVGWGCWRRHHECWKGMTRRFNVVVER